MSAATHAVDLPQDLAHLTERCLRRLFERLDATLDACKDLNNPKNVTATLRAVSLLLRLCTTTRARPPRRGASDHDDALPHPDDAPARGSAAVAPEEHRHGSPASADTRPSASSADRCSASLHVPSDARPRLSPMNTDIHRRASSADRSRASLAARAGLALGPGP